MMNLSRSSGGGACWQDLGPRVVLNFFGTCFLGAIEGREDGEEMGGGGGTRCGKGNWWVRRG